MAARRADRRHLRADHHDERHRARRLVGRSGAVRAASSRRPTRSRARSTATSSSARSTPRRSRRSPAPHRSPPSRRSWPSARGSSSSARRRPAADGPRAGHRRHQGASTWPRSAPPSRPRRGQPHRPDLPSATGRERVPRQVSSPRRPTPCRRPADVDRPRRDAGRRQAPQAGPGPDRRHREDDRRRARVPGDRHPARRGLQGSRPGGVRGHRTGAAPVHNGPGVARDGRRDHGATFLSLAWAREAHGRRGAGTAGTPVETSVVGRPNGWVRELVAPLPPGVALTLPLARDVTRSGWWSRGWDVVAMDFCPSQ